MFWKQYLTLHNALPCNKAQNSTVLLCSSCYMHPKPSLKVPEWHDLSHIAYGVMSGVKRLDAIWNSKTVLVMEDLIYIASFRQNVKYVSFCTYFQIGHSFQEPAHGKTERKRPCTNYINYITNWELRRMRRIRLCRQSRWIGCCQNCHRLLFIKILMSRVGTL